MSKPTNKRALRPTLIAIDDVLNYFASNFSNVHFVQVGANDGITDDPIHKYITNYKWSGVFVEPQEFVFSNQLKKTYSDSSNLIFVNAAISDTDGYKPFYKLSFTDEVWATGLASFNKPNLQKLIEQGYVDRQSINSGITPPPNKDDYIQEVQTRTITFHTLLKQAALETVNMLCIDVEGYDYNILKLFDFEEIKPEIVLYESKHLSADDFVASKKLLESYGYTLFWESGNTLAIRLRLPLSYEYKYRLKALLNKI